MQNEKAGGIRVVMLPTVRIQFLLLENRFHSSYAFGSADKWNLLRHTDFTCVRCRARSDILPVSFIALVAT